MPTLQGVGIRFDEEMSGKVTHVGEAGAVPIRFTAQVKVADLHDFMRVGEHRAGLEGTLDYAPLGSGLPMKDGVFYLFRPDPQTAQYKLIYRFGFDGSDGKAYTLYGEKTLRDDPGFDIVDDMTRLATTIYQGTPETGTVWASGEMRFLLKDLPSFVASMKVTGAKTPWTAIAARLAFLSFAYGTLRDEYLRKVDPVYDTQYENLAVQGTARCGATERPFFLVTGVHDRNFPWGDGEIFWDVLLLLGDGAGGWRRYAITDRVLSGLDVDVECGHGRYDGPVFEVSGTATSFTQMRKAAPGLTRCRVKLDLTFVPKEHERAGFPFRELSAHLPSWTTKLADVVHDVLPAAHPLGIWITPYTVDGLGGSFTLSRPGSPDETWTVVQATSFGEAERSTFRNVREPTLLYHYLCAIDPETRTDRVQIDARTMRNERIDWAKDHLDALVGALIGRMASAEVESDASGRRIRPLRGAVPDSSDVAERLVKLGPPLLQVDNDHFPTAIFQRNVVEVADRTGKKLLALEEDMRTLRLEPIGSSEKARVAAFHDADKFRALDRVLAETGFDSTIDAACGGRPRADFHVVIKPNFMFSYSKHDPSTFTDPGLVAHLARHLHDRGYTRVTVVEAQSSYGEYFTKRSVAEMAEYLGFDGKDAAGEKVYDVVDLTLDASVELDFGEPLGKHPVPLTWRDADFRISFAHNKTHAYAYYTLALKNVYGTLPMGAKFKEYHCKRGIYRTTLQWLKAFPVHFGLIDAYLSADGPFGVFADPLPNETHTMLGSRSLVALDWVGATKMGIDPLISQYMDLAVQQMGKPEIDFVGDASPYRPWLNVPPALTWFTHKVVDADYTAGNLFYAIMANMDSERFEFKDKNALILAARKLTKPLRDAFFVQTGERPSLANRAASWLQAKLGS